MDNVFDWSAPIIAASSRLLQNFLEYLPQLIGGIAILVVGWFVAKLLRALTTRLAKSFERVSRSLGWARLAGSGPFNQSIVTIVANIIFWLVNLFFLTSATNLLGLTLFSGWLDRVIGHLPNILSGGLIIVAGIIVGNLVNDAVRTATGAMPARQQSLLARGGQVFTVATMIVIGVDQIGIDITVLVAVFAIIIGTLLGGVAIAFSLGSRTLVSNLIGARYLTKDYRIGETIRVGDFEGKILELSSTAVVLDTLDGRMTVPARIFSEQASLLVNREARDAS